MSAALYAFIAFAGQGPAHLTPDLKRRVLDRIGSVLSDTAFVPGVDFSTWPVVVARHRTELAKAKTPEAFTEVVDQKLLGEYKVSHLALLPPGIALDKPHPSFGLYAGWQKKTIV